MRFDDLFKKAFEDDNTITDEASQEEITVEQINVDATDAFTEIEVQGESVEQIKVNDEKSSKGDKSLGARQ